MESARLLFQAKLANKELITKELKRESISKKIYIRNCLNYLMLVVNLARLVFYGFVQNATSKTEIVKRLLLGDYTYNWGRSLRKYLWAMSVDVFVLFNIVGYLFLFGENRHDWLKILEVLKRQPIEGNPVGKKGRKQFLKWSQFTFTRLYVRLAIPIENFDFISQKLFFAE